MLYKHVATNHSMHNLKMITKYVLFYMLCSIHPFPWLHLEPAVACCYHALKLLNNVAVSLLTLSLQGIKITAEQGLKSATSRGLVYMLVLVTTLITKIHGIHPWKDDMA